MENTIDIIFYPNLLHIYRILIIIKHCQPSLYAIVKAVKNFLEFNGVEISANKFD